ncbi:hypothetical protein QFZ94_008945 [Paraburkholderia sp. JPY465]|uniref:SWIM zinc finger family protein n=1 Tax=Paraburkholderia sp. JPY465 TaxID=3042285 RepID=UPI003D224287
MPVSYNRQQIEAWLGPHTVLKARPYTHAVSDLNWRDDVLSGKVQGSQRRLYETEIHFVGMGGSVQIEGDCTCPVGYRCKHMAALPIAGLAHLPAAPATGVHPALVSWLEGFRVKYAEPSMQNGRATVARTTLTLVYVVVPDMYPPSGSGRRRRPSG